MEEKVKDYQLHAEVRAKLAAADPRLADPELEMSASCVVCPAQLHLPVFVSLQWFCYCLHIDNHNFTYYSLIKQDLI